MVELFVPIAGMVMVVTMTALVVRLISAAFLNRTIREAMRTDPANVPLLIERLDRHPPWGDALLGVIFLALAAAMLLLGLTDPDEGQRTELMRAAIVPLVVGVAVLAYTRWARKQTPSA